MDSGCESKAVDLSSRDSRARLSKMMTRLFELWNLSTADQAVLLGVTPKTVFKYKRGLPLAYRGEIKERISLLLRIHRALQLLFPYDIDLSYRWVSSPNKALESQSPLDRMKQGIEGIEQIVTYLEWHLDN